MDFLLRFLYTLAVYISTPVILSYLAWRGLRHREYWRRWNERLGWFRFRPPAGGILVHAVSMGEVNGITPLVRQLMRRWPRRPIIFTSATPTGSARIRDSFGDQFGNQVYHCYLPLDLPGAMRRLYRRAQPSLVVVMETEIWPNFFFTAAARRVPLVLVNARLSRRSATGYRHFLPQARLALRAAAAIAAQTEEDARRFIAAGAAADKVHYCGNLKVDLNLPAHVPHRARQLRDSWGAQRPVWLGASTHEGEEAALLAIHSSLLEQQPEAMLILVPRHPERFERVVTLARQRGHTFKTLRVARHSQPQSVGSHTQVLVVDAMGVLLEYAAAAQLIFVGGSLVPLGGHNPLEPAALAKPVLVGPHYDNIQDLVRLLCDAGGGQVVMTAHDLNSRVLALMQRPDVMARMGLQARMVVENQRGAVGRTLALIEQVVNGAAAAQDSAANTVDEPR